MPWEKEKHGGVDEVPKKENGDCIHLVEAGCALFGKPERPYVCMTFDCRNKVREWDARGRPEIEPGMAAVIWAGIKLTAKKNVAS